MSQNKIILIRNAAKADFGGAERMPVFISRELKRYGFETIILSGSKKLLHFAKQQNVSYIKSWWWPRQNWSGWRAALVPIYILWQVVLFFYYMRLFISLRPSVVSLQSKDDFIAGTFAARVLNIKVFWIDHGDLKAIWMNHNLWYKNPVGKLVYLASHIVSYIVVASKSEVRLISNKVPGSLVIQKLKLIHNGMFDTYNTSKKTIDFISTARLVTDKGVGELIEAFSRVVKKHPSATLAIVGDGPEREKFKQQARGIPGITFYGHQSNPLKFLEKSRIFILPTHHEAFGVAVVEACMEGLAIIATDVGGIPEIISDSKSGILVPVKDIDSLYKAMDRLYKDVRLQRSLGKAARQRFLDKFNFSEIIKRDYLPLIQNSL